jgi:hypothetical protein
MLEKLSNALQNPVARLTPQLTTRGPAEPVGPERLALLKLFTEILRAQHPDVYKKYLDHKVIFVAIQLFFQFQWNNLLHSIVLDMIRILAEANFEQVKDLVVQVSQFGLNYCFLYYLIVIMLCK